LDSNNLTEKLNNFTSLVLKDANAKREKLLENVEKEYNERIDEKETELLAAAYENIQQGIQDAKKEANDRVRHAELESKKTLILRREEIIGEVMKLSQNKLRDFINGGKYEEWLIEKIEKAFFEVGKGSKTVIISADDIKLKEKIEQVSETDKITVEASPERDFLGGAKIINTDRKVSVDYSFKEMLAQQKQLFLQNSGLALN
jgi:V/A-type H+-transporting ATPase subunit E